MLKSTDTNTQNKLKYKKCMLEWSNYSFILFTLLLITLSPGSTSAQTAMNAGMGEKWVTVVLPGEPNGLEGCNSSGGVEGRFVKQNIVETLIERDPTDFALSPRLATSWKQVDPLIWQFELRKGAIFHDGSPLNAATVKKSLDRNKSKEILCKDYVRFFGTLPYEVSIVDDYTIQVKTEIPDPIMPMRMAGTAIVGPNEPVAGGSLAPVGTGPFVFDAWQPGQHIQFKRWDKYWGKKPEAEGVRYIWRAESAIRAAMVQIGEADLATHIAEQDIKDPEYFRAFLNSETSYLRLDSSRPPLDDRRVRLAINYALDRESAIGTIMSPDAILATQLVLPSIPGHNHDLDKTPIPYDPAKAKQLLAEARADGVPVDNDITLITYPVQYAGADELMEAYLEMLKAVGLNMKLKTVEYGEFASWNYKPFPEDRGANILQHSHDNSSGDPVFSFYYKYGCDSSNSAFCDPELDKEIEAVTKLGGQERIEGWQKLGRKIYEYYAAVVPLYHMVGYMGVGARVEFQPDLSSNGEIRIEEVHFK